LDGHPAFAMTALARRALLERRALALVRALVRARGLMARLVVVRLVRLA